jgi:hypothetical protein
MNIWIDGAFASTACDATHTNGNISIFPVAGAAVRQSWAAETFM